MILLMISPAAAFWISDYVHMHTPSEDWLGLFVELFFMGLSVLVALASVVVGIVMLVKRRGSMDWLMIAVVDLTVLLPIAPIFFR